jgi:arsenate reductase
LLQADQTVWSRRKSEKIMFKRKVLFICVHNSARSQMAAALLNKTCGEFFEAHSAGLEPGTVNPLAVEALQELGIDISENQTQRVFDVWKSGQMFQFVITVCSEAEAEGCPIFGGVTTRLYWSFDDPSKFTGTHEERLDRTRRVRDQILARVSSFCEEQCAPSQV